MWIIRTVARAFVRAVRRWLFRLINFIHPAKYRVLVAGMHGAGKSSVVHVIKTGRFKVLEPSHHPSVEEHCHGGVHLEFFVMAGAHSETAARLWPDYAHGCAAVIYVVDATDRAWLDITSRLFRNLLEKAHLLQENDVPVLVLLNKADARHQADSVSVEEVENLFGLCSRESMHTDVRVTGKAALDGSRWRVLLCSAKENIGIVEAVNWLCTRIVEGAGG